MASFPWKPLKLFTQLRREIDELFREVIHRPWGHVGALPSVGDWQPAVDVYETEDAFVIVADLPGVRPEDVQVAVEGLVLTICGIRRTEGEMAGSHGVFYERTSGRFCRTVLLYHPVDAEQMIIEHDQGTYHIRLPKKAPPTAP